MPRKVLVIEDEPRMLQLVRLILEREGYEVTGAEGGAEGLELIAREAPALVLLDLQLPGMNGWEVYQHMKADEQMKSIPVIVVTARAQEIDKVLGLHVAKVQAYITKPFTPEELLESVRAVLSDDE